MSKASILDPDIIFWLGLEMLAQLLIIATKIGVFQHLS